VEPLKESQTETDQTTTGPTQTIDVVSGFIMRRVLKYPGFVEWRSSGMNKVLGWTGFGTNQAAETIGDFSFDADFLRHYEAIHSWLRLHTTSEAAKDCEFYFRRYPFRGFTEPDHDAQPRRQKQGSLGHIDR
jgi:hypothetical protein